MKIDEVVEKYLGEMDDNVKTAVMDRAISAGMAERHAPKKKRKKTDYDSEQLAPKG